MAENLTNNKDLPLRRLRIATAKQHSALEQVIDWNRAFSSADNYFRLLLAYRSIIEPADRLVADFLSEIDNLPEGFESHIRTEWLMEDTMVVFGDLVSTSTEGRRIKPGFIEDIRESQFQPVSFNIFTNLASAIGVQYVLEGSSLGGQILSKHLLKTLGYTPVNGGCFFAGYGDQISKHWKDFSSWANKNLIEDSDVIQAEQAAVYTFRCFMKSFTELANE